MIKESRWYANPVTKPGYGEPEPVKPVSTLDSPENVATCLNCSLPSCHMNRSSCPLYGKKPLIKKGKARIKSDELLKRDQRIREMLNSGWRNKAICQELKIGRDALNGAKKRLRTRGELN